MVFEEMQITELREYERFKVNTEAYVAFVPYSSRHGKIIDISEKGLSFKYIPGEKPTGKKLMAILIHGREVFLKDIWFIPVCDCEIKNSKVFNLKKERKCGGKFVDLTSDQTAKLEFFIKNYTSLS
ncbi:MAG: PilZ domain-containing protein [Deltaproteobacteria bacterium]|nr:PilZ domain-containing protein [Deltaproteobacteria bacterium]